MSLTTKFIAIAVFGLLQMSPSQAASTNELQAIDRAQEACITDDGSNSGMKICTNEALKDADEMAGKMRMKKS